MTIYLNLRSCFKLVFLVFFTSFNAFSQTTIWSDNFDSPSGGANNNNAGVGWTLNTEGNSSNRWFINAPAGIGCTSSGNVLHISCTGILCGFLGGPDEPIYAAAANLTRTAISPNISTIGQTNLTLTFEFICEGSAGTDFGTLSLSSDGGNVWNDLPGEYSGVSSCSTKTVTIPAQYQNISNFKLRFRWSESDAADGFDPPFSIDNIRITTPNSGCIPPTVNAGLAASICSGETVNLGGSPTAIGGSGNGTYTYLWSPSAGLSSTTSANPVATPTVTTTYNLVVTQGGAVCTGTGSVTVTVNPSQALTTNPSGVQNLCAGQSIQITASAGFTNYSWTSPGGVLSGQTITADLAGNFQVFATGANGCLSSAVPVTLSYSTGGGNLTITPPGPIVACESENVVLVAQSGLLNYVWSNGANGNTLTVTETGGYSVSAQNANGCTLVSGIVDVTINDSPVANFTFAQTFTTEYEVQFTNTSSSGEAFLWNFGGNNTSTSENPSFVFAFDNLWPVSLTVTNNCGTSTATLNVNVIKTSINDLSGFNSLNLGPNPGSDLIYLSGSTDLNQYIEIKMYDLLGKLHLTKQLKLNGNFNEIIQTQQLSNGIYLIELRNKENVVSQKWIKQ
jgi:hypothetical protein